VTVDFPLGEFDPTVVAAELREMLEEYPFRGGAA
jgi:hypothetical protein